MEVQYYITADNRNPVREWIDGLRDASTRARIDARITRLRVGNLSGSKSVGDGVHEFLIDFGPGYRIYFAPVGEELIWLLCAGSKKRQQADIDRAKQFWADFKVRMTRSKQK
jgi:putative addiction module killer protein